MRIIDSHTAGEPTRVIVDGGPDLGTGPLSERLARFRRDFDDVRTSAILEPRGYDAVVGALLVEPEDSSCAAGVIFFNNTDYLGMCGHGAIGVAVTLAYLEKIGPGRHWLETPVGKVAIELTDPNRAVIQNVPSYRMAANVTVDVEGIGPVTGDIAWGGNWFFLVQNSPVPLRIENLDALTRAANSVKAALVRNGITGANGGEIDHIEFFGPGSETANSQNFVLCPGGAYDRSPCGTGTSAKLACLAADGKLGPGETWVQASIIGSCFEASYQPGEKEGTIIPTIAGHAYVCGDGQLIRQPNDPFANGILPS